ncbi:MAG: Asr1405/Asl0597 family protein [Cyanobacteria bacterium J06656_5]
MDKFTPTVPDWGQIVAVPRGERWSINRRLQELHISCSCPADGTLRVHVNHALELMLVHSVIRRFTAPRQAGVSWLERCWQTQTTCTTDH